MKFLQRLLILAFAIPFQLFGATATPAQTATTSTAAVATPHEMPHGQKRKDATQQTDSDDIAAQPTKRVKPSGGLARKRASIGSLLRNSTTLKEFIQKAMKYTRSKSSIFAVGTSRINELAQNDPMFDTTDSDGNTILHAAAHLRAPWLMKCASRGNKELYKKKNSFGRLAYDCYMESCREIGTNPDKANFVFLKSPKAMKSDRKITYLDDCNTVKDVIARIMSYEQISGLKWLYDEKRLKVFIDQQGQSCAVDSQENTLLHAMANLRNFFLIQHVLRKHPILLTKKNAAGQTASDVYCDSYARDGAAPYDSIKALFKPVSEWQYDSSTLAWATYISYAMDVDRNNKEEFAQLESLHQRLKRDDDDNAMYTACDSMGNNCLHAFARLRITQLIEKIATNCPSLKNRKNKYQQEPVDVYRESCSRAQIPLNKEIEKWLLPHTTPLTTAAVVCTNALLAQTVAAGENAAQK